MALSARKISMGERARVVCAGLPTSGEVSLNRSINTQTGANADMTRRFRLRASRPHSGNSANARHRGPGCRVLSTALVQRRWKPALGLTGCADRRRKPRAVARKSVE
jgi:hypothetical protein